MNPTTNNNPPSNNSRRRAFTLIELLVVISVIGVLAALTIAGLNAVGKSRRVQSATAEKNEIVTAIENYHAQFGTYPPGNGYGSDTWALTNQLYYELTGVTTNVVGGVLVYQAVDGSTIPVTTYNTIFNASGVLNCTAGSGEDVRAAHNFLVGLRANRVASLANGGTPFEVLVTTVGGPDPAYAPMGVPNINPIRYKSPSPTNNNPGSYDLWINLSMGATNLSTAHNNANLRIIDNWGRNSQNSQMP